MKNPSYPVHLTLLKSLHRTRINIIHMNSWHCLLDSFHVRIELHPPWPSVTFSWHASNCILLDTVLLCCPIFLLFSLSSYYIYSNMVLAIFPNITSSTWNLWPARWGITIHGRIKKYTLRETFHMHSGRQPIFIANQMFELPHSLCV